jgi:hypothetical protein
MSLSTLPFIRNKKDWFGEDEDEGPSTEGLALGIVVAELEGDS